MEDFPIFISYSRKDIGLILPIRTAIEEAAGCKCWMDLKAIESGSKRFTKDIISGINHCKVLLFMLTENSQHSEFALRELDFADKKGKHVVIVNVDDCTMTDEFQFLYGLTDTISWSDTLQRDKLLRDLKHWVGVVAPKADSDQERRERERLEAERKAKEEQERQAREAAEREEASPDDTPFDSNLYGTDASPQNPIDDTNTEIPHSVEPLSPAPKDKSKGRYCAFALLAFSIFAFLSTLIFGFSSSNFLTNHYSAVFNVLMYTILATFFLSVVGFIRPNWLGLQDRKVVAKTYLLSMLFCFLAIIEVGSHKPETEPTNTSDSSITVTANGVSFTMKRVQGGTFQMGSVDSDADGDESPLHTVTVSTFYMGETEVTQALWKAVMGGNPSHWQGDNLPVEQVSWNDVQEFIHKLNNFTGQNFRLPTEAEWEYAARGGSCSNSYKYAGSSSIDNVAWFEDNSGGETHEVKGKSPNELGLYDMSGNVWEWCQDWYGNYSSGSQTCPIGPSIGSLRVLRGGSWNYNARYCRVSFRYRGGSGYRGNFNGFRLCLPK